MTYYTNLNLKNLILIDNNQNKVRETNVENVKNPQSIGN